MRVHKRAKKEEENVRVFKQEEIAKSSLQISITPFPLDSVRFNSPQLQTKPKSALDLIIAFFNSPADVELVKLFEDIVGKRDDKISKLAHDMMLDASNTMYNLAKATLANLSISGVKGYIKALETYYKELFKRRQRKMLKKKA